MKIGMLRLAVIAISLPMAAAASPPTLDELANATIIGIADQAITLVDGEWQGEPFVAGGTARPAVGLVDDFLLTGDLDADGSDESVVLLWSTSGGSGTFDYLAAAGREEGETSILGTAALGDRVKVRSGRIVDGSIVVDVIQAGPEDAACCPTQMATRSWALTSDGLAEVDSEITGTLSLAVLDGTQWVLTDFAWDEPAPKNPPITLKFVAGRIDGSTGCNTYLGSIEERGDMATGISIGPVESTRIRCPEEVMTVEDRYLAQLGGVSSYSFHAGKLLLIWSDDEQTGLMLFTSGGPNQGPAPPTE